MDPITSNISGLSGATGEIPGEVDTGQDTFLRLLTTQLQNQDPSNPMSNEDFVAQLAQFSSLEQLVGMQETMNAVYMATASMNNTSMANLLGTDVVAYGDSFAYSGEGDATLDYQAAGSFVSGTVTVTDESGKVVATREIGSGEVGEGEYVFDGMNHDGQPLPEGTYTFSFEATDQAGGSVDIASLVTGTVTEMDYSSGTPQPSIGGVPIGLENILRLTEGDSQTPDETTS